MKQSSNAAEQDDARERELRKLRKKVEEILPYPVSANQRAMLDSAIAANLQGLGVNAAD